MTGPVGTFATQPGAQARGGALAGRALMADLAVIATVVAVVGLFTVSPIMLESFGIAYITSGGGLLAKVYPSTLLAVGALGLRCLAARHPLRVLRRLMTDDAGVVLLLASVAVAGVFGAIVSKTPVSPLIDTFVLPVLFLLLLRDLEPGVLRWLALLLALILCVNAAMGLVEMLRGVHYLPPSIMEGVSSDPMRGDQVFDWRAGVANDWRATALLGHPLVNGLIGGGFIICLASPGTQWIPLSVRAPLLLLQGAAMFAFGARAALVLCIVFAGWQALRQALAALRRGARLEPRAVAFGLVGLGLAIAATAILFQIGFFDRTVERFSNDAGSASTRLTMFDLFQPLSWTDIVLGPDKDLVATGQRINGLEFGIESSWLGLILTYGLVVTAIIVAGLAAFSVSVIQACGRGALTVLSFYFILTSVAASLSGKTTSLAMCVIVALVFLRRDERQRCLRSALRMGPG